MMGAHPSNTASPMRYEEKEKEKKNSLTNKIAKLVVCSHSSGSFAAHPNL